MRVENNILIPEFASHLKAGKEVLFTPSGVSMRPFIEGDRDSVIIAPLKSYPKRGDILLAELTISPEKSTYVLHRLVRIEPLPDGTKKYVLQGDGNLFGEENCTRENIIGIVTAIMTPDGRKKEPSNGRLWYVLKPFRKWLLKIYRHTMI